jgi:hypothetical protein
MDCCPFCKDKVKTLPQGLTTYVECPRCGNYSITSSATRKVESAGFFTARQAANISGWLRENSNFDVDTLNIDFLKNLPSPSFHERADKLLLGLEVLTEFAGHVLKRDHFWQPMAWAINEEEVRETISYLMSVRYLYGKAGTTTDLKIGPEGWSHLENIKGKNQESKQGFVAMWFTDEMREVFNQAMAPGILNAGYLPHRVDLGEHNKKIDDQIVADIRRSKFVLADFTGHRGGVYYEAGFAQGFGLEVIWSCREDEIDKLHFDIRQYNCIPWSKDKLPDFGRRITNRIEAVLGEGPYKERG